MARRARARARDASTATCGRLQEEALFTGEYDTGPAVVGVHAGAGGTDSQDWAEMLLRMYLRWAEARGFKTEILEATPGEEAGLKSATFTLDRRQRLRDHAGREGRAPAGAALAVRLRPPPPHRASPRSRSRRSSTTTSTSRSTRPTCASTRTARRAPAASTSTRPTRPCGSPTSRPGSSCSARTSARSSRTRPRRCGS